MNRCADGEQAPSQLTDSYGRVARKLRVSLTDRCNYRCVYCMPECPVWGPRENLLSFEELYALVSVFVSRFGVEQIRLTGGEPLMRSGAADFIRMLGTLCSSGLRRISLSSNGVLLGRLAGKLAEAGLDDVNVSLDSLTPDRFAQITGGGNVSDVLNGIEAARRAGLPVKVNTVVIRGFNETEVVGLCRWACREQISLRFIEFMPLDARGFWSEQKVFSEREILAVLGHHFELGSMETTDEPATYYTLDGKFQIGVIPTVSRPFCARCNRVRLTSDGRLFSCLFSPSGLDLRTPLRSGTVEPVIESLIAGAVRQKPRGFVELRDSARCGREVSMNVLGG